MASEGVTLVQAAQAKSRTRARSGQSRVGAVVWYTGASILAVIFFFPFFWTVSTSLKQVSELFQYPPGLFPAVPQWKNYATVLQTVPYLLWVKNSATVVVLVTLGVILTSSVVAYSFARFDYRGKNAFFLITLATLMLPAQITLIPQFILFNQLVVQRDMS
jgi:multiple sugar transport system permease protein